VSPDPAQVWSERDGRVLRLRLARPQANVLDESMIDGLVEGLARHHGVRDLGAVVLDADGPHFSFGASVEEHLPARCARMLAKIHALVRAIAGYPVPVLSAVHGQCLGGGLEVALAGHRILAAPDVRLGQPEIRVGVFAPAASCLLPDRVGRPRAEDLLLTGRSVGAAEALSMGLVDEVADDPTQAALAWFDGHLADLSASTVRCALAAARGEWARRLGQRLDAVEKLYLDDLMSTRDAVEGLNAFLEKRPAQWKNL